MAPKSMLCMACSHEARLTAQEGSAPKPGTLDYFPKDGRYGLLAVSGWSKSDAPFGTTLSILDGANMWLPVKRAKCSAERVPQVRAGMVNLVREMNKRDRLVDKQGADGYNVA
jgi:hypothetical protein